MVQAVSLNKTFVSRVAEVAAKCFYSDDTFSEENWKKHPGVKNVSISLTKTLGRFIGSLGVLIAGIASGRNFLTRDQADDSFLGMTKRWSFAASGLLVGILGYIFSNRGENQRSEESSTKNKFYADVTNKIIEKIRDKTETKNVIEDLFQTRKTSSPGTLKNRRDIILALKAIGLRYFQENGFEYLQTISDGPGKTTILKDVNGDGKVYGLRIELPKVKNVGDVFSESSKIVVVVKNQGEGDSSFKQAESQKSLSLSELLNVEIKLAPQKDNDSEPPRSLDIEDNIYSIVGMSEDERRVKILEYRRKRRQAGIS